MQSADILWVDLEMTGLDPVHDRILEVAAIATDWQFHELGTYEAAQHVDPALLDERFALGADFWDANPEARDALRAQNAGVARPSADIEDELIAFVQTHFAEGTRVLLGGNSIHQDRKFIAREWPRLDALLHYRMLDVSAFKVVFEGRFGQRFAKGNAHRALDDIRESIRELEFYVGQVSATA
ncbi:oligoribonuclease [Micrococcales bacterium 31B]|nr:oligoribonuclease [Micrococcales bacterium 31B]